jgi:hypothetical protein
LLPGPYDNERFPEVKPETLEDSFGNMFEKDSWWWRMMKEKGQQTG